MVFLTYAQERAAIEKIGAARWRINADWLRALIGGKWEADGKEIIKSPFKRRFFASFYREGLIVKIASEEPREKAKIVELK